MKPEQGTYTTLAIGATALVFGLLGYWRGYSHKQDERPYSRGPAQACSESNWNEINPNSSDEKENLNSDDFVYYSFINANQLEEKEKRMKAHFPNNELGRSLVRLTTLSEVGSFVPPAIATLREDYQKLVESQSKEALEIIQNALGGTGNNLMEERQFLIRLVGKLDIDIQEKVTFLSQELGKPYKNSISRHSQFTNLTALLTLLQLGVDYSTIEQAVKESIPNHKNYNVRLLILNVFESRFPEEGKRLKLELGIE